MRRAVELSRGGMNRNDGGPFGAVIVRKGQIIAEGQNQVTSTNDPSAHAEMVAIRKACRKLKSFQLDGCEIYTSCEPCPMCLGAIYWARPSVVYFANTAADAAKINFDDSFIYDEIAKPHDMRQIPFTKVESDDALRVFKDWTAKTDKIEY